MLVSVLMPARDAAGTVHLAVASLLRQTFADFQIVAVDDGSTDRTGDILDQMAEQDPRLKPIHLPRSGLVPALNAGIEECRGDLVVRMDADDICHRERLRLQVAYMCDNPDISVCGCLVRSFPRSAVRAGFLRYEQWLNSLTNHDEIVRDIFVESPLAHPSVAMRASDLREVGGYADVGWPEDYDLWLRLFTAGKRFGKVPRTLLFWRESPGRLTFTDSRYSLENFMRIKARFLAVLAERSARPVIVWGAGMTGRRLTKHLVREGVQPVAVVDIDPRKIGRRLRGAPVIWPEQLAEHGDALVIAAVGSDGARELIRERLRGMGRVEVRDFICAA
ncbi:MAG: glycosyltransferase [Armatimonadetes bacterium]|nr:glycosyltransferase [Armatimonadota bacterium]